MNMEKFVDKMVKIEWIEDSNCFGHYPFQMFSEDKNGITKLTSLAIGSIVDAYRIAKKEIEIGSKKLFLSLDFPAGGDIENDFVVVFSVADGNYSGFGIVYDSEGKILEKYNIGTQVKEIIKQFKDFLAV